MEQLRDGTPSAVLMFLTLFAIGESVNVMYVGLLFPKHVAPVAISMLGSTLDELTWPTGTLISTARANVDKTFWMLYTASVVWDSVYLWTGVRGAAFLDRNLLVAHIAQAIVTIPIMIVLARTVDPIPNGLLAFFRVATTAICAQHVMPLTQMSRGEVEAENVETTQRPKVQVPHHSQEEDDVFASPKHRPWKSEGIGKIHDINANDLIAEGLNHSGEVGAVEEEAPFHDLKVLYSYNPEDERMLTLREGEHVRVVARQDGWLFAIDCRGNEGFVPPTYLETGMELHDDDDDGAG